MSSKEASGVAGGSVRRNRRHRQYKWHKQAAQAAQAAKEARSDGKGGTGGLVDIRRNTWHRLHSGTRSSMRLMSIRRLLGIYLLSNSIQAGAYLDVGVPMSNVLTGGLEQEKFT